MKQLLFLNAQELIHKKRKSGNLSSREKKSARDVYLYDSIGSDKEGNEIVSKDVEVITDGNMIQTILK